jgi:hypothetical protein
VRSIDAGFIYEWRIASLYDYLTKEIGSSAGAAQRRMDAARLSNSVPEVLEKIKEGALNLSQISKVQQACRNKTGGVLKETILELARKVIKGPKKDVEAKPAATMAVKVLKSITPKLRREILSRDQVCQFRDPRTGKTRGSRYFLEVDHVHPKWLGGGNEKTNLRALCKNHNMYRYRAEI